MRIVLLNPNMTEDVTRRMSDVGKSVVSIGTDLVPVTATYGVPYISTRAEAQIAGVIVLEMLAQEQPTVDAAIVAAFGDPGVLAARELFDFPVIGVSEAAMLTACMLGRRFCILTFSSALVHWYGECVRANDMSDRCAGIFSLDESFDRVRNDQQSVAEGLVELSERALREGDADVVILGGAPLAGLAGYIRNRIPVPVVDPVAAAVKQAETLVALGVRKASSGSFRRPAPKETVGLDTRLAARIQHSD